MSLRINGLSVREIVVAANRARVKAPVNNLLRFAAEISGKALSNSNSFDWQAALAKSKAFIESTMDADAAMEILRPFYEPVISPDVPTPAAPEPVNEDEITIVVDELAQADSDGDNCD